MGMTVKDLGGSRGAAVHEHCIGVVERSLAGTYAGLGFQRRKVQFGDVRVDSVVRFPGHEGRRVGIQICHRNKTEAEARCLERLADEREREGGLDVIVSVSTHKRKKDALIRKLGEICGSEIPRGIVFLDLQEVQDGPEWERILGWSAEIF